MEAYDELEKYLKDDAISGFVILYVYRKETDKENERCHQNLTECIDQKKMG